MGILGTFKMYSVFLVVFKGVVVSGYLQELGILVQVCIYCF